VETLDFDAVDRCFAKMAAAGFVGLIAVAVWMWPAIPYVGGFFSSARWSTACERAHERPPLGDPMKEIVALYSAIGVILLSALSLGAVVPHAL
jgi:hypothetical protein